MMLWPPFNFGNSNRWTTLLGLEKLELMLASDNCNCVVSLSELEHAAKLIAAMHPIAILNARECLIDVNFSIGIKL